MNSSHTDEEEGYLAVGYLGSREGGLGPVDTTAEFEAMPPVMKVELVAHWIEQLRTLYCLVRDEAEASCRADLEAWDFFADLKACKEKIH